MVTCDGDVCTFNTVCGGAQHVFLVGEFNNWSTTAHPMHRCGGVGDGWRAQLRLLPGTYRFGYFVIHESYDGRRCGDVPALGLTGVRPDDHAATVTVPGHLIRPAAGVDAGFGRGSSPRPAAAGAEGRRGR